MIIGGVGQKTGSFSLWFLPAQGQHLDPFFDKSRTSIAWCNAIKSGGICISGNVTLNAMTGIESCTAVTGDGVFFAEDGNGADTDEDI